jgi:acetolactate synthase-1/2/3 large subunit
VASTLLGLSAVAADHPLFVGMLGMHGNYGANRLTNEADVIVAVGMRFDDRVTGRVADYARQARIIHIEIDPAEIDKIVPAEVGLVGDARIVLEALLPHIKPAAHLDWLARFRRHDAKEYEQVIRPELHPGRGPLKMGEVVDRISRQTRGEAIIVSDVGQHQMLAARHYRFRRSLSHITSGGLGTMGFALPAAIGAKIGAPDREVIAIVGDGGFQMTLQELGTLMQEGIGIKIVILNNGHLGMVRQWQELFFDQRYSSVALRNPDFVTICRGFGLEARQVSERVELDDAIETLLADDGPRLLEVEVGAQGNVFPMITAGASVSEIRLR